MVPKNPARSHIIMIKPTFDIIKGIGVVTPTDNAVRFIAFLQNERGISNIGDIAAEIVKAHETGTKHFTDELVAGAKDIVKGSHSLEATIASASISTKNIEYREKDNPTLTNSTLPNRKPATDTPVIS